MKETIQILLLTFCTLLASCASIDKAMTGSSPMPTNVEREKSVEQFPNLNTEQKAKFISGEPWIGMTEDQLQKMWNNKPIKTQQKLTGSGNVEVQVYEVRVGDWKTGVKSKYYKVMMLEKKVVELQEVDGTLGSLDNL